jgi:hypothetical protein
VKNRICGLMLVIVNTVQGKELAELSSGIQAEVETLKSCVYFKTRDAGAVLFNGKLFCVSRS